MIAKALHLEFIAAEREYLARELQQIAQNKEYFLNLLALARSLPAMSGKNQKKLRSGIRDCKSKIKMYEQEENYIHIEDQRLIDDDRGYRVRTIPAIIGRVARREKLEHTKRYTRNQDKIEYIS